jgi:hypothetical protein
MPSFLFPDECGDWTQGCSHSAWCTAKCYFHPVFCLIARSALLSSSSFTIVSFLLWKKQFFPATGYWMSAHLVISDIDEHEG